MLSYNTYIPTDQERDFVGKIINIEPNDISYMFFNDKNIEYINNQLIEQIKNLTLEKYGKKLQIQPQRKHLVIGIMRHIYFTNIMNRFEAQVEVDTLNKELLKRMVPAVLNELIAYMRYINDYNMIVPMDLPTPDNRKTSNSAPFSQMFGF